MNQGRDSGTREGVEDGWVTTVSSLRGTWISVPFILP